MTWVFNDDDLTWLLDAIETAVEVVIDLENTGLDEHAVLGGKTNAGFPARIVLASLTLPQPDDEGDPTTWVVPLAHPDSPWLGKWREVIRSIAQAILRWRKPTINHNMKYDARWIKAHTGVDLSHLIVWDTQISSHLLDENSSTKLKERAPATFGVERWDDFDLTKPGAAERVPLFELGLYGARDTYWTWRLADLHRQMMYLKGDHDEPMGSDEIELARLGRLAVWCAMPTVATLTSLEQRGMALDVEWVKHELAMHDAEAKKIAAELVVRYPEMDPEDASFAPTSNWFREWSQYAVDAGDLTVASLTPTGKARWSKAVLVRQARSGSKVAEDLLAFRGHSKKAEFLTSWLYCVTPDGNIHASYHAGRVITGRLSCSDPNLQQVTQVLKPAFIPRPGYVLADLDYSQIELRIAAFVTRSKPMLEAFRNGWDLHKMLALRIIQTGENIEAKNEGREPRTFTLDDVTPTHRQAGKSANFGLLYLLGPSGFREYAENVYDISFTMEEASLIHNAFFEQWDGISAWHSRMIDRAHKTGQVVSPVGRVRRVPGVYSHNDTLVGMAERQAVNSPVQGFGSDLMQIAAACIEGTLPGYDPVPDVRLVATVHDDIVVEVPADNWEAASRECQRRMVEEVPKILLKMDCVLDVPLAAEVKVGTRWGLSDVGMLT